MKQILLFLCAFLTLETALANKATPPKVLMLISTGFYAPEYFKPRKIFEAAGYDITVAAKYSSPVLPDQRQLKTHPPVNPDTTFKNVKVDSYDAIVFSGGNGAWEDFFPNEDVHKILKEAMSQKKILALLCSSVGLLGVANNFDGNGNPLAEGRNVTGYKKVVGLLKLGKVNYLPGNPHEPHVVEDGLLITGRDPKSSTLFGEVIRKKIEATLL